jgi:ABC-2 type transport system permease protein
MIGIVFALTLRQLLGRGRTVLLGLLALLPIGLALVYQLGSSDTPADEWVTRTLLEGLVVTTLLPLVALVYGTAALGAEIEDGTAVYLLAKPLSRRTIVLAKLLAAWALTTATVLTSGFAAGVVAFGGRGDSGIRLGFGIAIVAGGLVYTAVFLMLSIFTSRALIAGLVYVFVWEGVINGLFSGTKLLSIRHYTLAVADIFVNVPSTVFDAKLATVPAVALMAAVGIGSTWYAVRRLQRFEIGETT